MARILAIDYGKKRTGLAVTDTLQIISSPLTTVETKNLFDFVIDYMSQNEVEKIVVGMPLQMNGQPSESFKYIEPFVNRLKKNVSCEVIYHDERFTSKLALQSMITAGSKKIERREKSGNIDKISASIILQSYMESLKF
ncbi:MAG: Holliday junction resolvase RuvX [Rikenellaceae bacterium]